MRMTSVAIMVIFFFESVIPKVLDHSHVQSFFSIEDFTDIEQHRCRACTKTFELLLYASLSLRQA